MDNDSKCRKLIDVELRLTNLTPRAPMGFSGSGLATRVYSCQHGGEHRNPQLRRSSYPAESFSLPLIIRLTASRTQLVTSERDQHGLTVTAACLKPVIESGRVLPLYV